MNVHPSNARLEGHAAGDDDPEIARHMSECAACRSFVDRSRADAAAPLPSTALTRALAAVENDARRAKRSRLARIAFGLAPLAAAAATILFLHRPSPPVAGAPGPSTEAMHFKGGLQLATIRERGGVEERFTTGVSVHPGDRLRVEIAVDRERPVTAGILGSDGEWLTVLAPALLSPGTHFSERAAEIDARPIDGEIVAGDPDDVALARTTHDFRSVAVLPVHME